MVWQGSFVTQMRPYGCKAYFQIEKKDWSSKLGVLAWEGVLVGYSETSPAYRIWYPRKKRVMNVGSPSFDEAAEPGWWQAKKGGEVEKEEEPRVKFPLLEYEDEDEGDPPPARRGGGGGGDKTPPLLEGGEPSGGAVVVRDVIPDLVEDELEDEYEEDDGDDSDSEDEGDPGQ